jgi:general secretion pathway protein A
MLGAGVSLRINPVPRGPIVNEDFFGLRENPFSLTPNPRYIHRTRHAHETLGRITRGILDRKGLILLTGEVGTGKTTLLYTALHLLNGNPAVQHKIKTAVIVHPTLTREEFLESVLDEFDVHPSSQRRQVRLEALLKTLLEVRRQGGLAVLVIDEAQMLTGELLQEIRSLLDLQTSQEKLLQVILCGQPAIEAKVDSLNREGQPLEVVRCTARPLSQDETRDYVQHRMRIAGARSDTIFLHESVERVHERSGGIPRLVNLLCAQGLSVAAARQTARVTPRMVDDAAAKICAKARSPRIVVPVALEAEQASFENAIAPTISSVSPASAVSIRTSRRHKRAARRARVAEAMRRSAQVEAQAVAERVPTTEEVTPQLASTALAAASVTVPAQPAQKALAHKASLALKSLGSSLLVWNTRLNRWCTQRFTTKPRGKRLIQIGLAGIFLMVFAEIIGQLAPAHVVHVAFGFMGMLFIDIAVGLGLYLLLISRGLVRTRPSWAQAILNSFSSLLRRSG